MSDFSELQRLLEDSLRISKGCARGRPDSDVASIEVHVRSLERMRIKNHR